MTKPLNAAQKAWVTRRKKSITTKNNKFNALSPAQKRVAIAKDALQLLESSRLRAKTGSWVEPHSSAAFWDEAVVGNSIQKMFSASKLTTQTPCTACALGACFISAVRLGNEAYITKQDKLDGFRFRSTSVSGQAMSQVLPRYFSTRQLAMIEVAFERGHGGIGSEEGLLSSEEFTTASTLFGMFDPPARRMTSILNNIIKNNGTFIP